jgi:hypothetical protein
MRLTLLTRLLWAVIACCLALIVAVRIVRHTARPVYVRDPELATVPDVHLLDPNLELFQIEQREPNRVVVHWGKVDVQVTGAGRARMWESAQNTKVVGALPGGKTYPVVIDTGNPGLAAVTSTVVFDAGLRVYPIDDPGGFRGGVCHLPTLKMGDVTIARLACECWLGHYERRVLGRATWIERKINLGLGLLKGFGHIRIDGVDREVGFSRGTFQAEEPNDWHSYPMLIGHDRKGEERLVVSIPIDGRVVTAGLDTGVGPGLIMTEKRRAEVLPHARILGCETDRVATPGYGYLPCRKITLAALSIAGMTLTNATVHVTEDDNPFGPDDLVLGMGYVRYTVIVLDFEHDLLWIRNRPPRRAYDK